ncbi:MAG: hypothetical protein GXP17_00060 [Gammaproteobacteria bacterium]|nr:hypothetical protein [Gammaproteobacteria bacterium]
MIPKELLSAVAIALTFFAFFPYIRSILNNEIKPHIFSWVTWGSTTFIVFLAQLDGGGGVGAWPIGVSGIITLYVAFLAYVKKSDITITKIDWCFFLSAMASLPFWYFTADPLWAVIILTTVDVLGFGPTVRKAYSFPYEENLVFFSLFMARNIVAIIALEYYSLTTVIFPVVIAAACLFLIVIIALRRRVLTRVV